MHRVVPELIVENYKAGRYSGEFPAVGMFLDLSGFSTMTDTLMQHGQHGAEVLANLMHGVFDPLVESIFNHGGKIIGFAGDGIMALYPIQGEDRSVALSALASAWVLQNGLAQSSQRHTIYGTFQFTAKIGVALGSVSWGILHSEDRSRATYFFRGSAVESSASAEHRAGAGEILITPELDQMLDGQVVSEPVGSLRRLRGFRTGLPDASPTTLPEVDLQVARVFLPEEIVSQDVRGEFRQVVNLFIRFPDLADAKLSEVTHTVFDLQKKYGGLLNRIDFGDKGCNLLLLWGAPVAYENDIGRALNFILDLRSRVDIPITAGVTYYVAHAGYLGSAMCEDYTCYGWGVNLASRFMTGAPPGEIWVDDRIARRVSNKFILEFVGEQRFKGFSSLQRVHRLDRYNLDAQSPYVGEMIGREREMARLEKFVEPLWKQDFAGVLLVLGEAGIGKGRLVQSFRSLPLFEENRALWAVCQSEQILRQSFNPFRSWLFQYFDLASWMDEEARKRTFGERLEGLIRATPDPDLCRELDRLRSVLGALVDLYWQGSLYEGSDAEARYNSTLLALVALIKAESLRQPVILFVEDVQFIDEDSLAFLPRLKRALLAGDEFYPVAVIATSRTQGHNPVLNDELVDESIRLEGLPREAVARLVEILLGGVPSLQLVNLVMDRSEGNPFFVEQIVHYLQEEKQIEMSADGWKQVDRLRETFLPGDIGAVLVARLDQLSRKVKDLVQTASVFGREFLLDVLREMVAAGDEIEPFVLEAEEHSIWMGQDDQRYVFTHGLLRDAAYTMQMRARRQELHALAVRGLEKVYGDENRFHYPELAYHAEQADLRAKAQGYYTLAGRAASEAYQNKRGVEYISRALTLTPFREQTTQFDLLVERVELYKRLGEHASHLKDIQSLEVLARELNDPGMKIRVEVLYTHYFIMVSDYQAVLEHAAQVMAFNETFPDPDSLLKAYQVWPFALVRLGRLEEAMASARQGRHLAREIADRIREGYMLVTMGLIAIEQKEPSAAHGYLEEALAIAVGAGDRRLESRALGNLGYSAGFILQDYALAREYYQRAYEIHRLLGERSVESTQLGNLGWVAGMLGDFEAAFSYYARALPLSREVGSLYNETYQLINLGANSAVRGDAQASLEYLGKALELSRKTGDRSAEAWSYLYTGYAHLLDQDTDRAEQAFRESILIRQQLGQPGLETEPTAGLIQTLSSRGDIHAALAETEKILAYLQTVSAPLEGTEDPIRVYHACWQALQAAGDPRSFDVLRSAAGLLTAQASKLRDGESRRMFIENVPWRLAIHREWPVQSR